MSDCKDCDWTDICKKVISCPKALYGKRRAETNNFIGYESPITRIMGDIQTQIIQEGENQVFQAVQKCDVKVDRKELIKALQYDRGQYEKGYKDGAIEELEKLKTEILESTKDYFKYESGHFDNYCLLIISKRIAELKGESNAENKTD